MTIDYRGLRFPKGSPRVVTKAVKQRRKQDAERIAKAAVWKRANGRCERCGKRITKATTDLLRAGHVHHKQRRSKGGTWLISNLEVLCAFCHAGAHDGRGAR